MRGVTVMLAARMVHGVGWCGDVVEGASMVAEMKEVW